LFEGEEPELLDEIVAADARKSGTCKEIPKGTPLKFDVRVLRIWEFFNTFGSEFGVRSFQLNDLAGSFNDSPSVVEFT
jgi:hypothetical protein